MKNKTFSVLGHIMNGMNIQATTMAQALHVDVSLISKWRTGTRQLNKNSVYFDEVIKFILDSDKDTSHSLIVSVLTDLFPHETFNDDYSVEYHLKYALANENLKEIAPTHQQIFGNVKTVPIMVFNENDGRREAVNKILDYADTILEPAEITFFDCEEFEWLWENASFSENFVKRINILLKRNFHATFIIHYSSSKENFRNFFNLCSSILFDPNVDWFYCQYYNECVMNNSFIIINHAISMMGLSINRLNSSTMIFTDKNIVIKHEEMIKNALKNYYPLFKNYEPFRVSEVIENIPRFKNKEHFLSFLPVSAFIGVSETLLKEILSINNIDENTMNNVLKLNYHFRKITGIHYSKSSGVDGDTVLIFQLEKMLERVYKKTFVSNSLSLCCGKEIIIEQKYYATELLDLVNELKSNSNLRIVLASEKDYVSLPSINCWCMRNSYMLQMTKSGFRVCDESIVVNVASDALERCICRIPPERKEKNSVINFLLQLTQELNSN
ncbi:MAG: hypothetical protein ACI4WH_05140 [Oscillospiraceae bacterium]